MDAPDAAREAAASPRERVLRLVRAVHPAHGMRVRAPADPIVVGVELWVPTWWPESCSMFRLTALDPRISILGVRQAAARFAGIGPYIDVSFRVTPGTWQTVEFVLSTPPPPGSELEIYVAADAGFARWAGRTRGILTRLAGAQIRRVWVRGNRLRSQDVAIIVLNWNRPLQTITCLESLAAADLGGARVLVVDNGSHDGSLDIIRERFPEQRIIALPENRGYAGGNNAGVRAALEDGAGAVLILNNDTRVAPDFLAPLLWVLNSDARAAAVSSAVLRSDYQDVLESAYLEIYWGHGIIKHFGVNALPGEGFHYRREVPVIVGTSILFDVAALHEIGMLDESYFAYHEEVEWCHRARAAGYRVYWQPFSRVWHTKSTSTAATGPEGVRARASGPQLPSAMPLTWNPVQTYLGARNAVRFIRQHASLRQKAYFFLSSLYGVPLEFLATVMRQEPALKIGAWNYRKALSVYCSNPNGLEDPPPVSIVTKVLRFPLVLLRALPRDIRSARREGRLGQLAEHLRGLRDGVLNRPLPLQRLGLR